MGSQGSFAQLSLVCRVSKPRHLRVMMACFRVAGFSLEGVAVDTMERLEQLEAGEKQRLGQSLTSVRCEKQPTGGDIDDCSGIDGSGSKMLPLRPCPAHSADGHALRWCQCQ